MKNRATISKQITAKLFSVILLAPPLTLAAPAGSAAAIQPAKSVFIVPANSSQGRDPFFPKSLRPYESATVTPGTSHADLTALAMQGISGPPDHRLAIINNVTFGVGDVAEVRTPQGRLRVHCIDITGNTAVIEVGGQRQELHYRQP